MTGDKSISSEVHEFLAKQDEGATYTAAQLASAMGLSEDHIGAVGGYLWRASNTVKAFTVTRKGKVNTYVLTDKTALSRLIIRPSSTSGGVEGRKLVNRKKFVPPQTVESIRDRLLEIAVDLEKATTPLSAYSTDELLAELRERTKMK